MTWGALITDIYGNPWTTPDATPMSLVQKIVLNPASSGSYVLPVNSSAPFLVACQATANNVIFWINKSGANYTLSYCVAASAASPGTVTIYIFGYVIPQPLPKWGIAIWNAVGQCIITNETKVMTPPVGFGTVGSPTDIGYLIDKTVAGKFAVIPRVMGIAAGVIHDGGATRPWTSPIDTLCYYNGATSRISAGQRLAADGSIQNLSYSNSRDLIYAIDVSRY